jgi:hypothetical protein
MNGMTERGVQLVDFPYADDRYEDPKMPEPLYSPTKWQLKRDHKHDLAFRPLGNSLLEGKVNAIYSQSKVLLQNLATIDIGKDFMLKHNYIKSDFDVNKWATPEALATRGLRRFMRGFGRMSPEPPKSLILSCCRPKSPFSKKV